MDANGVRLDFGITLHDSRLGVIYSQSISIKAGIGSGSNNVVQNGAFRQWGGTNVEKRNQSLGGSGKNQLVWKKQDVQRHSYTGPLAIETWPARQNQNSSQTGCWMKQKQVSKDGKFGAKRL